MTVWITADTHFGHANIIKHCGRPFTSAAEMDDCMVARWNERVQQKDDIWHLGDFHSFKDKEGGCSRALDLLRGLHGCKRLIVGNHDVAEVRHSIQWLLSETRWEMSTPLGKIVMDHYPLESWNGSFHGAIHFHGHSHGAARRVKNRLDVGVDCWDFAPITMECAIEAARKLANAPAAGRTS